MLLAIQYIAEDLFPENMCVCGCVGVRVCAPIVGECCVCVCVCVLYVCVCTNIVDECCWLYIRI